MERITAHVHQRLLHVHSLPSQSGASRNAPKRSPLHQPATFPSTKRSGVGGNVGGRGGESLWRCDVWRAVESELAGSGVRGVESELGSVWFGRGGVERKEGNDCVPVVRLQCDGRDEQLREGGIRGYFCHAVFTVEFTSKTEQAVLEYSNALAPTTTTTRQWALRQEVEMMSDAQSVAPPLMTSDTLLLTLSSLVEALRLRSVVSSGEASLTYPSTHNSTHVNSTHSPHVNSTHKSPHVNSTHTNSPHTPSTFASALLLARLDRSAYSLFHRGVALLTALTTLKTHYPQMAPTLTTLIQDCTATVIVGAREGIEA